MHRLLGELPRFFSAYNVETLLAAAGTTLLLTLIGCGLGFGIAFLLVCIRRLPWRWALPLQIAVVVYVEVFRRIPFLVVTYLVLFVIQAFVADTSLFAIAVIAICLYAVAYTAEIIRGGFDSVPRPQIEAATTMNFGFWRTLTSVILPQSWPVILPPAAAFAVGFIKDTALVSQVGVFELTFRAKELNNQGYSAVLVFGTVALLYFAMSYPLSRAGRWLEARLASPGTARTGKRLWRSAGLAGRRPDPVQG